MIRNVRKTTTDDKIVPGLLVGLAHNEYYAENLETFDHVKMRRQQEKRTIETSLLRSFGAANVLEEASGGCHTLPTLMRYRNMWKAQKLS